MARCLRFSLAVLAIALIVPNKGAALAQNPVELIIFRDEDSLTIYVPGNQPVPLLNLGLEVTIGEGRQLFLLQDYEAFDSLYFSSVPTPICFRLERQGSSKPVPQNCHGITLLIQPLTDADVFWYDQTLKQHRTVLLMSVPSNIGICAAGQAACDLSFVPPESSLSDVPESRNSGPLLSGSSNRSWTPSQREYQNISFVYVPEGCFKMGLPNEKIDEAFRQCEATIDSCDRSAFMDVRPVRDVCLSGFWISQMEITHGQYRACVDAGSCEPPPDWAYLNESELAALTERPVFRVTWYDAQAFAEWFGGGLPTEAQWEYAARGPEGWIFPWGNEFDASRLNYCDSDCGAEWKDLNNYDGYLTDAPVGMFDNGASWVGALDMAGNVWEWTGDWYDPGTYATWSNGIQNPQGPPTGVKKVTRGGSWWSAPVYAWATYRNADPPDSVFNNFGFRIVVEDLPE